MCTSCKHYLEVKEGLGICVKKWKLLNKAEQVNQNLCKILTAPKETIATSLDDFE